MHGVTSLQSTTGFGELLRVRRERVGLTQQVLADHATLSVRAIRDMESGRVQRPRQETVRLLADALRLEGQHRSSFEAAARRQGLVEEPRDEPTAPPVARGAIVGRELEVEVLTDALAVHGDRLVTVAGLGGVGKTRLVLEVARRLHLASRWSVRWIDCGRQPVTGLARTAGERPTLLVLDGADAGVDTALLDELFHRCPGLRVLITARVAQPLPGGQVIPLAPLPTPGPELDHDPVALAEVGAVRLLLSHLRRLRPGFRLEPEEAPAVASICRELDGLPGALELVAGWSTVLSPRQLVARLADGPFHLAPPPAGFGGRADVGAALGAALDRLTLGQRDLLERLAATPGDWSGEDAVELSGRPPQECLAAVHELLASGLIRSVPARDGVRFTVLNLCRRLCGTGVYAQLAAAG
ncbi:helix-turn-helix domain-containing protein [Streptomyces sp. PCS3-D2]|uniref:helix-turn-helix domain-containing protein n=1 Tax=Streptomyces sp. PCS3-D2 TaxID=1460244 RepID=UPI00044FF3D3|nr:helix-turn-helix domain-containing protein [Streptomyces sp. PCS3-D2]WKV70812.1 helix-turn-helix domain-containing protein [Streptomyces sp. PCS3-D2]